MDDTTDDKDKSKNGQVLTFPGGKKVDTKEIGVDGYIVAQGGQVPTADIIDPKDIELENREREEYVKRQELVRAAEDSPDSFKLVDLIIKEISEELAHLKFERRKAIQNGKNASNYTVARIASLRQLSDIILKRQENIHQERLDLKSPEFKKILRLWMELVYDSMNKVGLDDSHVDLVFKQIEADMLDWEKRVAENVS